MNEILIKKYKSQYNYEIDMENIFPSSVVKDMNSIHNDGTIERLKLEIEEQVKLYFN